MKQLEKRIARALGQAPVPAAADLWNRPVTKMTEHDYYTRQEEVAQTRRRLRWIPAAAALCLCLCLSFALGHWMALYRLPDNVVGLDVNPSVELTTNRRGQVMELLPLNEDARAMTEYLAYAGRDVEEVVDDYLDCLIDGGYLSAEHSAVLLSVDGKTERADEMLQRLNDGIRLHLEARGISQPVLESQRIRSDKALRQQAREQGMSEGKMSLIRELTALYPHYSYEDLAGEELEDLLALKYRSRDGDDDGGPSRTQGSEEPDDDDDRDDDDDDRDDGDDRDEDDHRDNSDSAGDDRDDDDDSDHDQDNDDGDEEDDDSDDDQDDDHDRDNDDDGEDD